jgi:hypothetical protein
MPGLVMQLVRATSHLGAACEPLFVDFVTQYDASVGVGEYYNRPNLTADLVGLGFLPPQATSNLPGGAVTTIAAATPWPALVG